MKECDSIRPMLSSYYDGELDDRARQEVDAHLTTCGHCRDILEGYEHLTNFVAQTPFSEPPEALWSQLQLDIRAASASPRRQVPKASSEQPSHGGDRFQASGAADRFEWFPTFTRGMLAAAAAMLVIAAMLTSYLVRHDDQEMFRREVAWLAENLDSDTVAGFLAAKYDSQPLDPEQYAREHGYTPVAFRGVPANYSIEGVHVVDMPCCRCLETICRKPDGSCVVILEHDNQSLDWMDHSERMQCDGVECHCAEMHGKMIASIEQDDRTITIIGDLQKEDLDQWVAAWSLSDNF